MAATSGSQRTPIYYALDIRNVEMAKLLIDDCIIYFRDLNNITPLIWAARNNQLDIVEMLVQKGADIHAVDNSRYSALTWACENGQDNIIKFLLKNGANVNEESTQFSGTPLHMAAYHRHDSILELLLASHADPSIKSTSGAMPLHFAAWKGSEHAMTSLLASTADFNQQDLNGRTPLFRAPTWNRTAIISKFFLSSRNYSQQLSGNLPGVYGAYPAFAAVRNQVTDATRLLLEADSSVLHHIDKFGRNILCWALNTGNPDIIKFVSDYCEPLGIVSIPLIEAVSNPTPIQFSCWCEICTVSDGGGGPYPCSSTHACCDICNGGRYLICRRCREFGIKCRGSHELREFQCGVSQ